jgi:hypothetical protein
VRLSPQRGLRAGDPSASQKIPRFWPSALANLAGALLLVVLSETLVAQTPQPSPKPQFRGPQTPAIQDSTATAADVATPGSPSAPSFHHQPPPILDEAASDGAGSGFTGTEGLTNVPPGAYQSDRFGVPQGTLFRNTQYPYGTLLPSPTIEARPAAADATFRLTLPTLTGGLPWVERGFEPQNADLKVGPFYFKLRAIEAAILASDNINLTQNDRKAGVIGYAGITIDVMAQMTEDLRLATEGTFIYLPFQGKAGIAGFGLNDIYEFGLGGPLAHAQIEWDTKIGQWNVVLLDDFQIVEGVFSDEIYSSDVLFKGADFNDQATLGRYVLRPSDADIFQNRGSLNDRFNSRNNVVVYSNTASVFAERLLPGDIRLQVGAYNEDLWYNQGNRGLPELRQGATVSLFDEHENTRFKPYIRYEAFRTQELGGVQSILTAGITGPITDQLHLVAEAGFFKGGNDGNGEVWRLQLDHTLGPYTQQSLIFARTFTYFHDELDEQLGYNLRQIIGPKLSADLFAYWIQTEDFFSGSTNQNYDQWRFGARVTYTIGPKTSLVATGEYNAIDFDHTTQLLGRLELGYNFTDTLLLHLVYQFQESSSDQIGLNYSENLFFLSLTKYFE